MFYVLLSIHRSIVAPTSWGYAPGISPEEGAMTLCCPLGLWFLLAVPLGIAAIATFGKDKK